MIWFPFEFCNSAGAQKNYNDVLTRRSKARDDVTIRLDTVPALDRQTDRQTDIQTTFVKQYRALHAYACNKKELLPLR